MSGGLCASCKLNRSSRLSHKDNEEEGGGGYRSCRHDMFFLRFSPILMLEPLFPPRLNLAIEPVVLFVFTGGRMVSKKESALKRLRMSKAVLALPRRARQGGQLGNWAR